MNEVDSYLNHTVSYQGFQFKSPYEFIMYLGNTLGKITYEEYAIFSELMQYQEKALVSATLGIDLTEVPYERFSRFMETYEEFNDL